jgi:2',3'-cyclic-nucleotide 2'-phosphodiesterase (5'-nucleotidase family)
MRRTLPGSQILLLLGMAAVLAGCTGQAAPTRPEPNQGASGGAPVSVSTAPPAPALAPQARAGRGEVTVTVFHETHMHGALLGQDHQSTAGPLPTDGRTFANYVGVMDQQRRRLQAGSSLFVGNGDDLSDELTVPAVFGGGAVQTQGRHVLEAFETAGLDADTFGFDYLPDRTDRLRELVSRSRFAWVSANVRDTSHPDQAFAAAQGARLWLLKTVGGVRVGITGVVAPGYEVDTSELAAQPTPAVTVLDPVTALREVVPRMRAAGAQVVVVLSHLFFEQMEQVARQVDGVAAILGSHQGPQPYGFLDQPRVVGRTILSVAGNDLAALGQLDLVVRRSDGRIVRFGFRRHLVTPGGPVSPAVKAVLDGYLAERPR